MFYFSGNSVRTMRSVFARDNSGVGGEEAKAVRPRPVLPKSFNKEINEDNVILGKNRFGFWKFILQGSTNRRAPGLVNFVPALAYHFCLNLPAAFTNLGPDY